MAMRRRKPYSVYRKPQPQPSPELDDEKAQGCLLSLGGLFLMWLLVMQCTADQVKTEKERGAGVACSTTPTSP